MLWFWIYALSTVITAMDGLKYLVENDRHSRGSYVIVLLTALTPLLNTWGALLAIVSWIPHKGTK